MAHTRSEDFFLGRECINLPKTRATTKLRDGETTIKIKVSLFEGGALAAERQIVQNAVFFVGNATTIKFWMCKFYCREILLSLRRLLKATNTVFLGRRGPRQSHGKATKKQRAKTSQVTKSLLLRRRGRGTRTGPLAAYSLGCFSRPLRASIRTP